MQFQIATRLSLKKNKRNVKPYKKKQPVKIQLKGLTILPEKTCDTENGEGERYQEIKNWNPKHQTLIKMKKSRTVSSNIPKLSLFLLTNPNLFVQEYSIPSIQATGLFFNSIFFQFKIRIFVSCSLYIWIPQIFNFFWKNRFESIFLCVCVWWPVRIRRSLCCYLGFGPVTSVSSPSQWRHNQRSAGP